MSDYHGTIEFLDLEGGVWVLTTSEGKHYQLFRAPKELLKEHQTVTISGQIRTDVMTAAQVGPVLEVTHFVAQ